MHLPLSTACLTAGFLWYLGSSLRASVILVLWPAALCQCVVLGCPPKRGQHSHRHCDRPPRNPLRPRLACCLTLWVRNQVAATIRSSSDHLHPDSCPMTATRTPFVSTIDFVPPQ